MGLMVKKMSKQPVYVWTHLYEKKRNMDWYYSLVLAYQVWFEDLNFKPTEECEEIGFFSLDEMRNMPITGQVGGLLDVINFEDFK